MPSPSGFEPKNAHSVFNSKLRFAFNSYLFELDLLPLYRFISIKSINCSMVSHLHLMPINSLTLSPPHPSPRFRSIQISAGTSAMLTFSMFSSGTTGKPWKSTLTRPRSFQTPWQFFTHRSFNHSTPNTLRYWEQQNTTTRDRNKEVGLGGYLDRRGRGESERIIQEFPLDKAQWLFKQKRRFCLLLGNGKNRSTHTMTAY